MIEFYINGQKIDVQIEDEETIGDVLHSFELTCEENKAAVIGILVDGKQITADIFDEYGNVARKQLQKNGMIESGTPVYKLITSNDWSVISKNLSRSAIVLLVFLLNNIVRKFT